MTSPFAVDFFTILVSTTCVIINLNQSSFISIVQDIVPDSHTTITLLVGHSEEAVARKVSLIHTVQNFPFSSDAKVAHQGCSLTGPLRFRKRSPRPINDLRRTFCSSCGAATFSARGFLDRVAAASKSVTGSHWLLFGGQKGGRFLRKNDLGL